MAIAAIVLVAALVVMVLLVRMLLHSQRPYRHIEEAQRMAEQGKWEEFNHAVDRFLEETAKERDNGRDKMNH